MTHFGRSVDTRLNIDGCFVKLLYYSNGQRAHSKMLYHSTQALPIVKPQFNPILDRMVKLHCCHDRHAYCYLLLSLIKPHSHLQHFDYFWIQGRQNQLCECK